MELNDFKQSFNQITGKVESTVKKLGAKIKRSKFSRELGHLVSADIGIKNEMKRTKSVFKSFLENIKIPKGLKKIPKKINESGKTIRGATKANSIALDLTFSEDDFDLTFSEDQNGSNLIHQESEDLIEIIQTDERMFITNEMSLKRVINIVKYCIHETVSSKEKMLKKVANIRTKLNKDRALLQKWKNNLVDENSTEFIDLTTKINAREQEINNLLKFFQNSADYLANLSRETTDYLENNEGFLHEESLVRNCRNQAYVTSVCLTNGSIPPKLSKEELEIFTVLHNKSLEIHQNLDWEPYKGLEKEWNKDQESWINAINFVNETAWQVKNDILNESATQKIAVQKYHSYIKIANLLCQQGNLCAASAIQGPMVSYSLSKISRGGHSAKSMEKVLEKLPFGPDLRKAFSSNQREGILSIPPFEKYTFEREQAGTAEDEQGSLNDIANLGKENQERLQPFFQSIGTLTTPSSSPFAIEAPLEYIENQLEYDENTFEPQANQLFPS